MRFLFRNGFRRDELAHEMRAHREMLEEQFIAEGMSPCDASAAARRRFGNETGSLELSRDQWGFQWVDALRTDLTFALRLMRNQRLLTATIVAIAGLGVGANTAIVSVLETVMLKPLGLRDSEKVIVATVRMDKLHVEHAETSGVEYRELQGMKDIFQSVAASEPRAWVYLPGEGGSQRWYGRTVTADFFRVFREQPYLGRLFNADDRDSLVLSFAFWKSRFAGDPGVIGRTVVLSDGHGQEHLAYRIVGVADKGFRFPSNADCWTSMYLPPERYANRTSDWGTLLLLGRLSQSATMTQAADRVNRYVAALRSGNAEGAALSDNRYFIDLESFAHYVTGDLHGPLLLLWAAALTVLLTACANVAVLLLSRTAGRRKEMAIRLSLGATRWQILRQLAVESLVLGALAGLFGIAIGVESVSLVSHVSIPGKQILELVKLDRRLMFYAMALSMGTALLFGLAPALQLLRSSQAAAMTRGAMHRFQNVFIAGQIAAALVLLIATGLLLRSLRKIENIQPGFDASNLTTAMMIKSLADPGFFDRLETALRSSPGVESAAIGYPFPFLEGKATALNFTFAIKDRLRPKDFAWLAYATVVTPGYFEAVRIPVLRGRTFAPSDKLGAPEVCVITATFAERFFPGEDPVGHEISVEFESDDPRIIGVVPDVRTAALERAVPPGAYFPVAQLAGSPLQGIVVRSRIPAAAIVREAVRKANGSVPVYDVRSMQDRISQSLGIRRVVAMLVCVFAAICILLAGVGLNGAVAHIVGERSGEVAVRMALGAYPSQILRHFLAIGLRAGIAGLVVGLFLAFYVERWLGNLLYGVTPFDMTTFGQACAGILLVVCVAVFWPARLASRIQPSDLLRRE